MMMIMMTMMLMMLMQMTLSFDERAARSDFTESTCICPWGQRASGTHAIGRVAREGLRSPPGAPGQTEQQNLGKSVTECIWVRCVLGADDLCEKAGSAHVSLREQSDCQGHLEDAGTDAGKSKKKRRTPLVDL